MKYFPYRPIYWLTTSVLAALPLFFILVNGAESLTLGNESLAYRFFYSYRILHGEGGNIVLAQGYLLSALQNFIVYFVNPISLDTTSLRSSFTIFSNLTIALNTFLLITAFTISSTIPQIKWTDRILLIIVGLGPIYATSGQGFRHSLWPDYYHLNVALAALSLTFFQATWRRFDIQRSTSITFVAALFVGACTSNKITAGVLGIPFLLLTVFDSLHELKLNLIKVRLAFFGIFLGCAFPILFFYQFNLTSVLKAFSIWLKFIRDPGGDVNFYSQLNHYIINNHLWLFFGLYIISFLLFSKGFFSRGRSLPNLIYAATTIFGFTLIYSVFKRPAGTSIFESAIFVSCFGAILLTLTPVSRLNTITTITFGLAISFCTVFLFPWHSHSSMIQFSKHFSNLRWEAFDLVKQKARGRPIIFFIPDNQYQSQDVFVTLLKGMADFPTWHVSNRTQPTLNYFIPNLQFKSIYDQNNEQTPKNNVIYIWNDVDGKPLVQSFFPELDAVLQSRKIDIKEIDLQTGQKFKMLELD